MFGKFLLILLLGTIAVAMVARSSHGAGPERSYVVKPSDTLWSIAARSYAGDDRAWAASDFAGRLAPAAGAHPAVRLGRASRDLDPGDVDLLAAEESPFL